MLDSELAEHMAPFRRLRAAFDGIPTHHHGMLPTSGGSRTTDIVARDLERLGWQRVRPVKRPIRPGR
jgi:hypothetical protein